MGKVLIGIVVALASFMMVESLVCNKCSFSLFGVCLNSGEETCTTNTTVCYSGTANFPALPSFSGFKNQGCKEPAGCNATTNGTLLFVTYEVTISCCSSDKCNPVNAAPSSKMTLTAALGAAILASMWGSML